MVRYLIGACFAFALPAMAADISITGCVEPGIEAGCLLIKDAGTIYNVTHAKPTPQAGQHGTVSGTLSEGVDYCQAGMIIDPAVWTPEAGKSCPAP